MRIENTMVLYQIRAYYLERVGRIFEIDPIEPFRQLYLILLGFQL